MSEQLPPSASPAPNSGAEAPAKAPRRLALTLALAGAGVVALIVAGTVGLGTWVWRSDAGTGWVLGQVPGLTTEGLQGALGGNQLSARKITYRQGDNTLVLEDVGIKDLAWRWRPYPGAWVGLAASEVAAGRAQWTSAPPSGEPTPLVAPASLRAPLQLQVQAVRIGTLQVDTAPAVSGIALGGLQVSADNGSQHRVESFQLSTEQLELKGSASIATDTPLALKAQVQARSLQQPWPWQASATAEGPLTELRSTARLTGSAQPGREAPALDATATLRPFAAWPLGELQLSTRELDLSSFALAAPQTRLSGQIDIRSSGLASAASARIAMKNLAPGRWDQGRAPVRSISAEISGVPAPLDQLKLTSLLLELGNADTAGGRVSGEGELQAADGKARVALQMQQIRPAALDNRASPMTLSGPLTLQLSGLPTANLADGGAAATAAASATSAASAPSTPVTAPATPPVTAAAPAPASAASGTAPSAGPNPLATVKAELKTRLRGRMEQGKQAGPEVELNLDTLLADGRIELRELLAQAAGARAELKGKLERSATERWQWQVAGALKDFDPRPWWPGAPDGAWRKGPHRFNATIASEASAPQAALTDPLNAWRQFTGQLALQIAPSQLAGVPLQGELKLNGDGSGASFTGRFDVAGNTLTLDARPDRRTGAAGNDSARAQLKAPALAALAPLFALDPTLQQAWAPSAGSLEADLQASGRDSALRWQGSALASGLVTPTLRLQKAELSTQGSASIDAPLSVKLNAQGLSSGEQRADQITAELSGSVRAHRLTAQLDSPLRPPVWFEQILGARTGSGTRVQLSAEGGWQPTGPAAARRARAAAGPAGPLAALLPGAWQGRVIELLGRARDGSGQPWLAARDLRLSLALNSSGGLQMARAEPGRIVLPGTALRWTDASYQAGVSGGGLPQLVLNADLEPFALAPLLDRAQPELGWRGDLMLGGEIKVRRGARFDADVVLERRSGDLSLADELLSSGRSQPLGLSDLRVSLAAHDGVWHITQALAGQQLGELAGVVTVRTRPDVAFPPADAPLDGVLQLNVARLDAWGAWVPPGWRVGGALQTKATFGGSLGAPEITGRLNGSNLSVRNALEGVQLSDGVIDVSLQGEKALVERFEFKGGDGRLALKGEATLGESPRLQLQIDAERFTLLGRIDRRVVTSGKATVEMTRDALKVDGDVNVDEGLIDFSRGGAPALDSDVVVVNASGTPAEAINPGSASTNGRNGGSNGAAKPAPARVSDVNLRVDLGERLRIKGRGLDTALRGQLRVSSPGGRMAVNGTVRTERGTYAAYSQKLTIERGELIFTGPVDNPRLDILAVRSDLDVVVGVAVTGSAQNPRVRLTSIPEMSDTDKLSWLVLGREPSGLGQTDTALLQSAAMALLSGESPGPTDKLIAGLGLTDFSVGQTGEGDVRETVVTLGKQLSRRWYVGYERSVNATAGTWQLIYRAAQRFTVRAQSGEDNAIDVVWTWRWD